MYKVKTAALKMEIKFAIMQVMKDPTQSTRILIRYERKGTWAAEITINGYKACVVLDPCT